MMEKTKLLIDTDGAADDLLAILLAHSSPHASVIGITTVAGAVPVHQATQNVLRFLSLIGMRSPVSSGRTAPLFGTLQDSTHILGKNGIAGQVLPRTGQTAVDQSGVDFIRQTIRENPGELTIVCLGPLTNLALALAVEPELSQGIKRLVIMGGSFDGIGNITPFAEFNFWVDPEAVRLVLGSAVSCDIVGWDATRTAEASFNSEALNQLAAIETDVSNFCLGSLWDLRLHIQRSSGADSVDLPDPYALLAAIDEDVVDTWTEGSLTIDTTDDPTRGACTFLPGHGAFDSNRIRVAHHVNKDRLFDAVVCALEMRSDVQLTV